MPNPALGSHFHLLYDIKQQIRHILRTIVTMHPERWRLALTEKHYALIIKHFMIFYLNVRYGFSVRCFLFRH